MAAVPAAVPAARPGRQRPGRRPPGADAGPSLAALVTITVAWPTLTGQSATPAEVGGYGTVDAADARDLAAAAARDPRTRWCITALHPDGTAAAHGCAPGTHPPPGTSTPTAPHRPAQAPPQAALPDPAPDLTPADPTRGPTRRPAPGRRTGSAGCGSPMTPITRGSCDHPHAETGYRPSRKLRHLVRARNTRCTAPGCGRPAARCDVDHTIAWDQGGLTCECDLAPSCKR